MSEETYKTRRGETVTITLSRSHVVQQVLDCARGVVEAQERHEGIKFAIQRLAEAVEGLREFDGNEDGWGPAYEPEDELAEYLRTRAIEENAEEGSL